MSSIVTNSIAQALGYKVGHCLTEGFLVKCAGTSGTDSAGNPIVINRHLIAILGQHLPGAQVHAIGNHEFTDDLWTIDPAQTAIDWSAPKCQVCGQPIAP